MQNENIIPGTVQLNNRLVTIIDLRLFVHDVLLNPEI